MRTYQELSAEERERAVDKAASNLLEAILEGAVVFDGSLQDKIDEAYRQANEMHTPWFAHKYIMDTCRDEIMSMAQVDAENSLYARYDEAVIWLD